MNPISVSKGPNGWVLAVTVGAVALGYIVRDHLGTKYDAEFDAAAVRHGVPANLLRAIMRVESGGNPAARNPKVGTYPNGSYDTGLMQINTKTGAALGYTPAQLLEPVTSINAAARVLAQNAKTLGPKLSAYTWPASYNVGPDLEPKDIGAAYAAKVLYHQQLFDLGRMFA